jgi:deoxyribonuclease V
VVASEENGWPTTPEELVHVQRALSDARPPPWRPIASPIVAGVWFAAPTGSSGDRSGERAWVAAVSMRGSEVLAEHVERARTAAGYLPGLLALREGRMLERAVRALPGPPDVLLVNATGRDHPRGAGLALHLGAALSLPTVGVTDRPLVAEISGGVGKESGDQRSVRLGGQEVAALVRTRAGARPVVVHAAWRTDVATAVEVVLGSSDRSRTPEPLRHARRLARLARARDEGHLR